MTTTPATPTTQPTDNHPTSDELGELNRALPPDAVTLAPSGAVPLRAPGGAWGLVIVAIHTTRATGMPDLAFGRWLPAPPPADLHAGDLVVCLHRPTLTTDHHEVLELPSSGGGDPGRADADADADSDVAAADVADAELLAAHHGRWHTESTWHSLGPQWPHELAVPLLATMRALADAAFNAAQWATLTGPVAALAQGSLASPGTTSTDAVDRLPDRAPDALAALIDAGLLSVGEHLVLGGHTATVGHGGVLHNGPPYTDDLSAVSALATSLTGTTVNGWHLWRRARDHRLLADLRTDLATR